MTLFLHFIFGPPKPSKAEWAGCNGVLRRHQRFSMIDWKTHLRTIAPLPSLFNSVNSKNGLGSFEATPQQLILRIFTENFVQFFNKILDESISHKWHILGLEALYANSKSYPTFLIDYFTIVFHLKAKILPRFMVPAHVTPLPSKMGETWQIIWVKWTWMLLFLIRCCKCQWRKKTKVWVLLRVTIPRRTCRTSSLTAELQVFRNMPGFFL